MVARTDRSRFADWWWTIDRTLLACLVALLVLGLILSFAASPPVAERIRAESFYFVKRHALYFLPSLAILVAGSFMNMREVRRVAMVALLLGIGMLAATLFIGQEVKGAKRWISFAGMSIQPSEFVKPAFVIVVAWLFAERQRRPEIPGALFALLLLVGVLGLLLAQPDFGQTVLTAIAWVSIFYVAGTSMVWVTGLGIIGLGGVLAAYTMLPHVASRIDRFLDKYIGGGGPMLAADNYQSERALESFQNGGWFGRGPGEGTIKWTLPDSHTDFIFAVLGEEFGLILCIVFVSLITFIVVRGLRHALREDDPFVRLAITGLITLFGVQAAINMAVNLHLIPAKGMTLPFVSYGGSSMLAVAFGMSALLALTRKRPQSTTFAPSMHSASPRAHSAGAAA
jgi:cell division protein FtsW